MGGMYDLLHENSSEEILLPSSEVLLDPPKNDGVDSDAVKHNRRWVSSFFVPSNGLKLRTSKLLFALSVILNVLWLGGNLRSLLATTSTASLLSKGIGCGELRIYCECLFLRLIPL